jgi:uncharacterized protein DUF3300
MSSHSHCSMQPFRRAALLSAVLLAVTVLGPVSRASAATFSAQIPDAARWADGHHYMTGTQLTDAMAADRVPWDPSVQALLPFPSVLEMMASDRRLSRMARKENL